MFAIMPSPPPSMCDVMQDYRDELRSMDHDRQALVEEGQRLMRASSDVRASDIQQTIARLDDKWARLQEKTITR